MSRGAKILWIVVPAALLIGRSYNICGGFDCIPSQFVNDVYELGSYLFSLAFAICALIGAEVVYSHMKKS